MFKGLKAGLSKKKDELLWFLGDFTGIFHKSKLVRFKAPFKSPAPWQCACPQRQVFKWQKLTATLASSSRCDHVGSVILARSLVPDSELPLLVSWLLLLFSASPSSCTSNAKSLAQNLLLPRSSSQLEISWHWPLVTFCHHTITSNIQLWPVLCPLHSWYLRVPFALTDFPPSCGKCWEIASSNGNTIY